jgi:uncharacterized integral membrane protein
MGANRDVRLNEMRSLFDLGLFPLSVCAGAAFNVAVTLILTRWVRRSPLGVNLAEWIAIVLAVNLLPVVVLRVFTLKPGATYRPVREMSFFADQHKFPLWIYFLASANMTLWIVVSWLIFGRPDDPKLHFFLIVAAIAVTAFPAWIRLFHR